MLIESTIGQAVRACGLFATRAEADDALAAYLTKWHGGGTRGYVVPTVAGFAVKCSRVVKQ